MTAVMCSKWAGDMLTHPLYHALLELKCIPFLEAEPVVIAKKGGRAEERVNLDLCTAGQVMSTPAKTLKSTDMAANIAKLLLDTSHGAFPVVAGKDGKLLGLVGRPELTLSLLLMSRERENRETYVPKMSFNDVTEFIDSRKTKENSKEIR